MSFPYLAPDSSGKWPIYQQPATATTQALTYFPITRAQAAQAQYRQLGFPSAPALQVLPQMPGAWPAQVQPAVAPIQPNAFPYYAMPAAKPDKPKLPETHHHYSHPYSLDEACHCDRCREGRILAKEMKRKQKDNEYRERESRELAELKAEIADKDRRACERETYLIALLASKSSSSHLGGSPNVVTPSVILPSLPGYCSHTPSISDIHPGSLEYEKAKMELEIEEKIKEIREKYEEEAANRIKAYEAIMRNKLVEKEYETLTLKKEAEKKKKEEQAAEKKADAEAYIKAQKDARAEGYAAKKKGVEEAAKKREDCKDCNRTASCNTCLPCAGCYHRHGKHHHHHH